MSIGRHDSAGFAEARGRGFRVVVTLLAVAALLGLAGSCVISVGTASAAVAGGPKPDPPPPPPPPPAYNPPPPPPPAYNPPPPPPAYTPPPPPPAYTPPPPPPVAAAAPKPHKKTRKAVKHQKRKLSAQKKEQRIPVTLSLPFKPKGPDAPLASGVPGSIASVQGSSHLLPLLLGIGLGLSLLVIASAVAPPWVLPRPVGLPLYEHRDQVLTAGVVTAISIALGFMIALLGS